jgi:hypothetical protein
VIDFKPEKLADVLPEGKSHFPGRTYPETEPGASQEETPTLDHLE